MPTWITEVLNNLIHGRPLCNLCYTTIEDTDTFNSYNDEVAINYNGSTINLHMSEIIEIILAKTNPSTSISDLVCHTCVKSCVASFCFSQMCMDKSKMLMNIVKSLTSLMSLYNTHQLNQTVNNNKILLLTTNNKSFTCNKYTFLKSSVSKKRVLNKIMTYESKKQVYRTENRDSNLTNKIALQVLSQFKNNKTRLKPCNKIKSAVPIEDMMCDIDTVNFKCKICHEDTKKLSSLKNHFAKFHASKIFKCRDCCKIFGSLSHLNTHKSKVHKTVPVCSKCGKLYKNMSALKRHEENHKSKIICGSCGKIYKNKHTYNDHFKQKLCKQGRRSNAEAKFICHYCNKRYCYKTALRVHIRFDHGDGEHHICEWCKKKFYSKSALNSHIVKHTKDKNFSCEVCGGRFVTKASLLYHTRIHTGETPYACQICDSRFLSASRRADHIRRHHLPPSLACGLCPKLFKNHSSLNKHRKLHKNPSSKHYISKAKYTDS